MKKTVKQPESVKVPRAEFARMANVSRAAITKAIKAGLLVADKNGMIDVNADSAKFYIESHLNPPEISPDDMETADERRKNMILKNIRLKQEIDFRAGRVLDKNRVHDSLFMYMDNVYSNLERLSGIFLDDITSKILTEGLTPAVRSQWKNAVLSEIDNAKNATVLKLEALAESQKN